MDKPVKIKFLKFELVSLGERGVGFSTLLPFLLLESACGYKIEIYWTVIVTVTKILFLPPISDKT